MAAKFALLCILAIFVACPIEAHNYKKTETKKPKAVVKGVSKSGCPSKPLDKCDFYFEAKKSSVPEFALKDNRGDYKVTYYKLRYSVKGYDGWTEVDSTGKAQYIGCNGGVPNQFYLNGYPGSFLKARTFNTKISNFKGCCIILRISHAMVKVGRKIYNLRPGDKNSLFPESRRCVVFKTDD